MGGTLPVISRIIIKEKDSIGEQFCSIYAVNTFGAVFGVLLAGYYLIPSIGLRGGIGIAAFINLTIAAYFLFYFRSSQNITAPLPSNSLPPLKGKVRMGVEQPRIQTLLVMAFAISGFASTTSTRIDMVFLS